VRRKPEAFAADAVIWLGLAVIWLGLMDIECCLLGRVEDFVVEHRRR
jgi:hypothetical protein